MSQPTLSASSLSDSWASALRLYQAGQLPQAEAALREILQATPQHAPAWHLLALIAHQVGQNPQAIEWLSRAIALAPREGLFHANLGEIYRLSGRVKEAIAHGEKAVALAPQSASAHSNLGIAYYDNGELDPAQLSQERALALDPRLLAALNNLGSILRGKKKVKAAMQAYRRALSIDPRYAAATNNLASLLIDDGQPEAAIEHLQSLVQQHPRYADAHSNLGNAFLSLEQWDAAEAGFRQALQWQPQHARAALGLGHTLRKKSALSQALQVTEQALVLHPDSAELYVLLGDIWSDTGTSEKAQPAYEQALKLNPLLVSAYLSRGTLAMTMGDLPRAQADMEHALQLDESNLAVRVSLAQVRKTLPNDPNLQVLVDRFRGEKPLLPAQAILVHFALGKCFEELQQYDQAFAHYSQGCQLQRQRIVYDADQTDAVGQSVRSFFSAELVARLQGQGCDSNAPIFVLGMPRSGTTLVESILASHPAVFGAGELPDILNLADHPHGRPTDEPSLGFPQSLHSLTPELLKSMGEQYVQQLHQRAPDALRLTDKMPNNFWYLGLIHLMLPKAKVIHVKRHPLDVCLSNFTQLFHNGQYQSYDLVEQGRYYQQYERLMAHWKSVLPPGAFYEVEYEKLVQNHEGEVRALLDYCQLDWDAACLDFHKTRRSVHTASVVQVRQPLYQTSIEKWRRYEKHLAPLLKLLA